MFNYELRCINHFTGLEEVYEFNSENDSKAVSFAKYFCNGYYGLTSVLGRNPTFHLIYSLQYGN